LKYGYSNFSLEILEYCNVDKLVNKEQFYMNLFEPQYNILKDAGSSLGLKHSEETKAKLANKKGSLHHRFGIKRPEDEIKLMRINYSKTKPIYQYTSNKTSLIAKFDSLREAHKVTGITRNYIVKCIKANKLVHNKWFFTYDPLDLNS